MSADSGSGRFTPGPARSPLIRDTHLARRAVVYTRQSSDDQVRDHEGSAAAQFDQAELARRWGWPESAIEINDRDLGISGTATVNRPGFRHLLDQIARGEVGIVIAQATDRLSRKAGDFMNLLDAAQETDTLLGVGGSVYDPASEDAQMLSLQVQGMFGAFDNRLRARRMMEARVAKAARGQAVSGPPTGYLRQGRGEWVKDPDRDVQEAIERIFELYPRLGSLSRVVRDFRAHGRHVPRRLKGRVVWGPCDATLIHSILRNPAYAGDYVFRRRVSKKRAGKVQTRLRSRADWIVFPDHHDAYVPREVWNHIQETLAARRPHRMPLLGKGNALLQGILRCNVEGCDRPMRTRYWGRDGMARTASYTCIRRGDWGDRTHRVVIPALFVDEKVSHELLKQLTAIDRAQAQAIVEHSELERAAAARAQRRRIDDAAAEAARLRKLALNTPGEFAHARMDLMREFDAAVARHHELERQQAAAPSVPVGLRADDVDELVRLTTKARELWDAPNRSHDERKRVLRAGITEVVVLEVTREAVLIDIVWKSGERQRVEVLLPRGVNAAVKARAQAGASAELIAQQLNAAGVVTATGRPLTANVVHQKQGQTGVRLKHERQRAREIIREALLANTPRPDILRRLQTAAPRLGPWDPQRLSEAIRQLRRRISGIDPLPATLPAEEEKQRALMLVQAGLAGGKNLKQIAVELSAAGLRPPRGTAFNPVQVRLLYLRAHGLRSFKLHSAGAHNGAMDA